MSGSTTVETTIGSGSDTISISVAGSRYLVANAQFTVSVDGVQIGGVQTVSAKRNLDQSDVFTVEGNWTAGPHTVTISLVNSPSPSARGALYIEDISYDGQTVSNTSRRLAASNARTSYTVNDTTAVPATAAAGESPASSSVGSTSTASSGTGSAATSASTTSSAASGGSGSSDTTSAVATPSGTASGGSGSSETTSAVSTSSGTTGSGSGSSDTSSAASTSSTSASGGSASSDTSSVPTASSAVVAPSGNNSVGSSLNLTGYHLSFDWEANDFSNSATPGSGSFTTTLSSGLRSLENGDQEYWTDSSTGHSPYALDNGVLDINATYVGAGNTPGGGGLSYDSGVFSTQGMFSQKYGYFEMRAELPAGAGMWPAFWLLDNNSNQTGGWPPELDALEAFGAPAPDGEGGTNQAHWAVHSHNTSQQAQSWETVSGNETTSFHTYGVLWTPTTMSFVYDGHVVAQTATPSDYTQQMYMIVDLAVGGTWPGDATGENATMKVDYLRAFSSDSSIPAVGLQSISSPDGGGTSLYGAITAGGGSSTALTTPTVAIPATVG